MMYWEVLPLFSIFRGKLLVLGGEELQDEFLNTGVFSLMVMAQRAN